MAGRLLAWACTSRWLHKVKAGGRLRGGGRGGRIHENPHLGLTRLGPRLFQSLDRSVPPSPLGTSGLQGGGGHLTLYNVSPSFLPNWEEYGPRSQTDLGSKPPLPLPAVNPGGHTIPQSPSPSLNPTFRPSGLDPDRRLPSSLWI